MVAWIFFFLLRGSTFLFFYLIRSIDYELSHNSFFIFINHEMNKNDFKIMYYL